MSFAWLPVAVAVIENDGGGPSAVARPIVYLPVRLLGSDRLSDDIESA